MNRPPPAVGPHGPLTTPELLRVLRRRWHVIAGGLVAVGLIFLVLLRSGGAYVTQNAIIFVPPGGLALDHVDEGYRGSYVNFAAAVERRLLEGRAADRLAENANLYATGIDAGYRLLVPNSGGQWQQSFRVPGISVQVAGPSRAWVRTTADSLLGRIGTEAEALQRSASVASADRIDSKRLVETVDVQYMGSTFATQVRALLALGALGLGLSVALAVLLDRGRLPVPSVLRRVPVSLSSHGTRGRTEL